MNHSLLFLVGGTLLIFKERTHYFNKTKKKINTIILEKENCVLNVTHNNEIKKQIQMIGLTEDDLIIIKNIQPFILEKIDDIVEKFYKNLEHENSLLIYN